MFHIHYDFKKREKEETPTTTAPTTWWWHEMQTSVSGCLLELSSISLHAVSHSHSFCVRRCVFTQTLSQQLEKDRCDDVVMFCLCVANVVNAARMNTKFTCINMQNQKPNWKPLKREPCKWRDFTHVVYNKKNNITYVFNGEILLQVCSFQYLVYIYHMEIGDVVNIKISLWLLFLPLLTAALWHK